MAENPARGIKAPRVGRSERSAFAPDVVRQIVDAQPEVRDQACLMLLGRLGLRRDELRQLQIHDVDLARDTVRVQGKGGKVVVLPIVFEALRMALRLYLLEAEPAPAEYLLYAKALRTRPMHPGSVNAWFDRCVVRAGLPRGSVTPHEMRHSAADAVFRSTGNIVMAQMLLRHESPTTTAIYLHPTRDDLAEALRGLDASWGKV